MDTSATTITIETIIITINNKTLESSKVNSNKNEMLLELVNWIVYGIIMIED